MDNRILGYARAFVAVGRELHFGRAALSLGLTQSAVSRQVAELEAAVGFSLVQRTTRQVALTAAGQRLWTGFVEGLASIDDALGQAGDFARGHKGVVRIGYTRVSMICRGGVAIQQLRNEVPDVLIEMHELGTNAQVEALAAQRIDIGLLHPPVPVEGLRIEPLGIEPIVITASPRHPRASDTVALAELADEPMILYPRAVGPVLYDAITATCAAAGFSMQIVQHCTSWETAVDLAGSGLGLAWAPRALADRRSGQVATLSVSDALPELPCALAIRRGERSGAVHSLADRIARRVEG